MKAKRTVLQYTWYPKDWQGSDIVYLLGPIERCTYREFIDLAMEHGNEIPDRSNIWWKKWNYDSLEQLLKSISDLIELGAIQKTKDFYTVPSCEKRLERAIRNQENGRSGGRPKKPKENPEETEKEPRRNPEETQLERPIQYNTIQDKRITPILSDVIAFFVENGYTEDHAKTVFEYYDSTDWHDKNKQDIVTRWRFQLRQNWMKEEGKKSDKPKYKDLAEFIEAQNGMDTP